MMKTLRLILGDQLSASHSWYRDEASDEVSYLVMEMDQELTYVTHHVQKVVAFFLAMRAFAERLREDGRKVIYLELDDENNAQDLKANVLRCLEEGGFEKFEYQLPDEWRLDQQLRELCDELDVESEAFDTEHFLTERGDLEAFFEGKKQLLMESFYRGMRKKHGVLMTDDGEPEGDAWNFDQENRKKLPKNKKLPEPKTFPRDVSKIVDLLEARQVETIGRIDPERFIWPVTREAGLELLDFFLAECLPDFGDYQDAMTPEGWSLFHSRLSFALNTKLIGPEEVIRRTEEAWRKDPEALPLSSVEGFIRQILGWREYMRGVYWMHMPDYAEKNFFGHDRDLPSWFWTGDTRMACLSHAVDQSLEHAYAHHIQRLMVTGNFALMAGVHPDAVDRWYLGIYIDALDWVEITNTRGMSQFADGGIVATKPYVASANYMQKMSRYCSGCAYDPKKKSEEGACPLNSLYWHFLHRHRDKLGDNPRMGMVYRVWDRFDEERQRALLDRADDYLGRLDEL